MVGSRETVTTSEISASIMHGVRIWTSNGPCKKKTTGDTILFDKCFLISKTVSRYPVPSESFSLMWCQKVDKKKIDVNFTQVRRGQQILSGLKKTDFLLRQKA